MAQLLVSVRSPEEAEAALKGGAALIDVKEPSRGSLGRADDVVLSAVVRHVGGRRPVSAARGELADPGGEDLPGCAPGLAFLKWGLAGARHLDWREALHRRALALAGVGPALVVAAYADAERADAPSLEEVAAFVLEQKSFSAGAFLIDTWLKDGSSLLSWVRWEDLERLCRRAGGAGVPVALAGSLEEGAMRRLRRLAPDWFAVRGAACSHGRREATVEADRVRGLVELCAEGEGNGTSGAREQQAGS